MAIQGQRHGEKGKTRSFYGPALGVMYITFSHISPAELNRGHPLPKGRAGNVAPDRQLLTISLNLL